MTFYLLFLSWLCGTFSSTEWMGGLRRNNGLEHTTQKGSSALQPRVRCL